MRQLKLCQLGLFLCSSGLPAVVDVAATIKAGIWIRMMINNLMSNTQPLFMGMFISNTDFGRGADANILPRRCLLVSLSVFIR
ncbi:unnamed protein product [Lactuca virosa]|uniref:Secreted protein n=1 Tax=Lactuca virosa TaxID=75947 RepID=A0AAU9NQ95_9ASTR|nr:unnamed protein product [Lactuca virosa]